MTANVEVRDSDIKNAGRGLFAKKDFQSGELVLSLDRPYVAELDIDRLADTCAWCFQRGASSDEERANAAMLGLPTAAVETKACTGCKRVRYCSKICQSKAWKREHKFECKALAPESRPDLPHGVRAVIKLLGRLKSDPEGKDEALLDILQFKPSSDEEALEDMRKCDSQRFEDFGMLSYGAWKYSGEPKIGDMDSNAISKAYFFNVMSNTLQLSSALDDTKLGIGFDPILCSANHSCEPNSAVIFNQPKMLLRAIKPIKRGEEIFIKYVDVTNPTCVRQAELQEQYFFNCQCSKCKSGLIHIEDKFMKPASQLDPTFTKVADGLLKRHEKQISKFTTPIGDETSQKLLAALQAEAFSVTGTTYDFNKGNEKASEDEIKDALRLTMNSGLWHITRQPVPHLLRQLLVLYMSEAKIYRAWRVGIKMYFEVAPYLNKESFYPDRVIDTWMLTNVSNSLCNPNNPHHRQIFQDSMKSGMDLRVVYMGFLIETRENLDKSYGKDSPFGRVVESMYRQTMENSDILLKDAKDMVQETWPKLEAVAKSVDVLKL